MTNIQEEDQERGKMIAMYRGAHFKLFLKTVYLVIPVMAN